MSMKRREFLAAGLALTRFDGDCAGAARRCDARSGRPRGRRQRTRRDSDPIGEDDQDVQIAGHVSQRASRDDRRTRRLVDRAAEGHRSKCADL